MAKRRAINGQGSVYRRGDGKWCGALVLENGKRRVVYGRTQRVVVAKLEEARRERSGGVTATADTALADFLAGWLQTVTPSLRPSTAKRYEELTASVLPVLGRRPLRKVSVADVERLYAHCQEAGLSARTASHVGTALGTALRAAVRQGLLSRNPVELAKKPRVERKEMMVLSVEEVKRLLETAKETRYSALWVLLATSGCREGEALGAKWTDLDFETGTLRIQRTLIRTRGGGLGFGEPKTDSSRRTLQLTALALDSLRQHKVRQAEEQLASPWWGNDAGLIFTTSVGSPVSATNLIKRDWRELKKRAGLPETLRIHDLRHGMVSMLLASGLDIKTISAAVGHSRTSVTTDIYSHLMSNSLQRAADAMDEALAAPG